MADDCPADLVGTSLDPTVAIGESIEVLRKGWADHARQKKARRPITIVSFRC